MTIDEAKQLKPGDRVLLKHPGRPLMQNGTVIERPSESHAKPGLGYLWVEFDGRGINTIRQMTVHAREILRKQESL